MSNRHIGLQFVFPVFGKQVRESRILLIVRNAEQVSYFCVFLLDINKGTKYQARGLITMDTST